jgi:hypothetical protein
MSDKSPKPSWRDTLAVHPAADLFPLLPSDELRALGEDIIKNGLTSPIVLWRGEPKGQARLLDGRNRLDAIEMVVGDEVIIGPPSVMAGKNFMACDKVIELGKTVDPYAYVVSANIHRRHLTAEQRRELIAKLLKATPEKSDRQIAKIVKADNKTVASVRREKEAREEIPHVDTRRDSKGREQPAHRSRKQQRAAIAATAIMESIGKNVAPDCDGIGPDSSSEIEGLRARNEELENKVRRLEIENAARGRGLHRRLLSRDRACAPA